MTLLLLLAGASVGLAVYLVMDLMTLSRARARGLHPPCGDVRQEPDRRGQDAGRRDLQGPRAHAHEDRPRPSHPPDQSAGEHRDRLDEAPQRGVSTAGCRRPLGVQGGRGFMGWSAANLRPGVGQGLPRHPARAGHGGRRLHRSRRHPHVQDAGPEGDPAPSSPTRSICWPSRSRPAWASTARSRS